MRTLGRYRLVERIASGGMAEVWRAEAPGPDGFVKEVALKLVRPEHGDDGAFVRMFVREARLASLLTHANVVQVFDFDRVDGQYYLAMELVRGRTLRELVDASRAQGLRLGLARAVHVGAEVARALAYAHGLAVDGAPAGLVHRDVSPQNVLVSFEGEVKLADFGIARALGATEATAVGAIRGKLAYMAPEQARGEAVDGRADVFALGVVLWELCAGRRLFARDSDAATLSAVTGQEPIAPPSAWNEAVPPELDAVILGALERDAARRTSSAEALSRSLAGLRMRLAGDQDDLELRGLMRRLWPDAAAPRAALGAPEPPGGTAAAPAAPGGGEAPDCADAPGSGSAVAADLPTVTAPATRRGARRRRALQAGLGVAAAAAVWGAAVHARGAPARSRHVGAPPAMAPAAAAAVPAATVPAAPPATAPAAVATAPAAPEAPLTPAEPPPDRASPPVSGPRRAPSTGQAVLEVKAVPWAYVSIDGRAAGETPLEVSVPARRHRVRAWHPTLGHDETVVELVRGQRLVWRPRLLR